MLTVNITYHANTRLMEITSISTGGTDNAVATTGDHLSTRLQFTFDDPDNTLLDYGKRVDFGVIVADSDGHAFNPFIVLNNENYVDIPEEILSNVKCGVLPIQLVMGISDEGNETVLQSLNQINLAINKAIDSTAVCPDEFYPRVRDAVVDVGYDDTSATFTFTRLDGMPIYINLTDLSEEHYEVQHYADLDTLTEAESGDTATVLDTGVWYKLYISHGIRAWYPMSGNATINGEQTGTPVFYAPHVSGTQYQMLVSDGQTEDDGHGHVTEHPPVWTTISKKYILFFTSSVHDIDVPNEMGTNDLFCKFTDSNGNDIMLEYYTQTKNNTDYITISTNLSETINMQVFAIPYVRAVSE